ncbi:MAG TPA: hypothetical protein VF533_20660, partial [Solirubrobacteraceae bacterium]
ASIRLDLYAGRRAGGKVRWTKVRSRVAPVARGAKFKASFGKLRTGLWRVKATRLAGARVAAVRTVRV